MPQDNAAAYGAMDPFGQFLMAAYLQGNVPGGQTSAYNTVLDLLSPGAVAGRQEAGVPNVGEQFANMFGGINPPSSALEQMQQQTMGTRLTPQDESTERVAMNQALLQFLTGRGEQRVTERGQDVTREGGMAGVDVQKEDH